MVVPIDSHYKLSINDFFPFADVQHLFKEGDEVAITEKIRSNSIYICRDTVGNITVTSKRFGRLGLVLPEYYQAKTRMEKFTNWLLGRAPQRNYFWSAAYNSGIIGTLKYWPKMGNKIEVFGTLVPSLAPGYPYTNGPISPSVLVERVSFDGKDQGYHSFFANWTPLLYWGKWEPETCLPLALGMETISGKQLHVRDGVVIRHTKLKYLTDGRPLLAVVYPKDVEAWTQKEAM